MEVGREWVWDLGFEMRGIGGLGGLRGREFGYGIGIGICGSMAMGLESRVRVYAYGVYVRAREGGGNRFNMEKRAR